MSDNRRLVVELMEVLYSSLRVNIKVTRLASVKTFAISSIFMSRTFSCTKLKVQAAGLISGALAALAVDEEYSDIGGAAVMHEWSSFNTVDHSAMSIAVTDKDGGDLLDLSPESSRLAQE